VKARLTTANASLPSIFTSGPSKGLLPTPVIHSLASSTAELVSCAILTPAEVIKQNAQMVHNGGNGTNVNATVQTLARFRSNPLALWRGYAALAGRNLPFTALQFPMLERLRAGLREARRQQNTERARGGSGGFATLKRGFLAGDSKNANPHGLSVFENGAITAMSAGLAGSVAAVITTPIDVIKTRIMLSAVEETSHSSNPLAQSTAHGSGQSTQFVNAVGQTAKTTASRTFSKRPSALAIGQEIIATEGMKGIWRGGALRAVWTMVGSGLYLGAYESVRVWLALRRGEEVGCEVMM
jgi:solute carrier family 25 (mitochondrial S-adenosylmethionine transporter), member 26